VQSETRAANAAASTICCTTSPTRASSCERTSASSVAPLGDDVPRRPAVDEPDVRARELVDPAERHVDDRPRAARIAERPSSGYMPACAAAVERQHELLRGRRAEDDSPIGAAWS
jgi:hypothetical protein